MRSDRRSSRRRSTRTARSCVYAIFAPQNLAKVQRRHRPKKSRAPARRIHRAGGRGGEEGAARGAAHRARAGRRAGRLTRLAGVPRPHVGESAKIDAAIAADDRGVGQRGAAQVRRPGRHRVRVRRRFREGEVTRRRPVATCERRRATPFASHVVEYLRTSCRQRVEDRPACWRGKAPSQWRRRMNGALRPPASSTMSSAPIASQIDSCSSMNPSSRPHATCASCKRARSEIAHRDALAPSCGAGFRGDAHRARDRGARAPRTRPAASSYPRHASRARTRHRVAPRAVAAPRAEELVVHRIEHDADLGAPALLDVRDRDVPVRDAAQEIVRAVDRIDDPAAVERPGERRGRFLAEKRVIRKRGGRSRGAAAPRRRGRRG